MTDSTAPGDPVAESIEIIGQLNQLNLWGIPGEPGNLSIMLAELRNRAGLTAQLLGRLAAILQDQHRHGGIAGPGAGSQVTAAVDAIARARADTEILASPLNAAHEATGSLRATASWIM